MTMHHMEERETGDGDESGESTGQLGGQVFASDPVCGMDVAVRDAELTAEVGGVVSYFCSQSCKSRFERHPEKYT